ncbi:TIGR03013 family PEP-CTERM/XrtA system glycosyltransferase [Desulfovibrio mangrovi]|uniref:TIGR03013 family XrtA/PEP-CTERM system glycosyltransferase n=1 Tax=Desulfovibrio mangrovi TaxID=2976983 RepID=UPI002245D1B0|nr:TIGR03013 family XrtA/PEP-CTERM system glycosyltransferase [Desulfovibrio mangrovi]UZP67541.1 TIGR03013 family PEP-CTERM/XrtA system glycosyltransferase [Desulfovibrio mangrovi]
MAISLIMWDGLWFVAGVLVGGMPLINALGADADRAILVMEFSVFCAVVLCASVFANTYVAGRNNKDKEYDIFFSTGLLMLISTSVLLLLNQLVGMFSQHAYQMLVVLCCFGLFRCGVEVLSQYWLYLPFLAPKVLVIGNGAQVSQAEDLVLRSNGRFRLKKVVDCSDVTCDQNGLYAITNGTELHEYLRREGVDKVIVSFSERRGAFPVDEILQCRMSGIEVVDAVTFYESVNKKLFIENITPSWFIFSSGFRISTAYRFCKRVLDICGALFGLAICLPFFPLVALAIKLDSPGPIFFRQVRVGEGDKLFIIFKLRTMRQDAEVGTGAVWASKDDPRITRLGAFLRKSRLDELPQLINVLRGEMSLVGPRPERPEFVKNLKKEIPFYSERHYMKPGVTGWAQVRYPYGASLQDAVEKLRYDLYYIKNYSPLFDVWVILLTIGVVVFRKGAR